ncbi:hypothetical protein SAMN05519103_08674 [Rhizobiales bacterium GAS113]|nr:hypothetical protein SAMN05519103_08674 [Rhizobiales bacterium GAS113]
MMLDWDVNAGAAIVYSARTLDAFTAKTKVLSRRHIIS